MSLTHREIHDWLIRLNLPRDGHVHIHAGMSRLSKQGLQADVLIEALLDYFKDGTLMMPAMSWRAVNLQNPNWYERETPAITGILSEIFRQNYASHRSIHPTHSVSGYGVAAAAILSNHELDSTPCSANSPYGHLANMDKGFVILLDVGMDSCTLVHHGEETAAPDIYLKPEIESYNCYRADGSSLTVRTRRHTKLYRNFWQFEDLLADQGLVYRSDLGNADATAFPARDMHHTIMKVLSADPNGTIAKPGQRSKLM